MIRNSYRAMALLLGLSLLAGATALTADPPPPPDPADDPLPDGAKVRYGVTRPILRTNPAVALIPPTYANFLAPTLTAGARRYDLGTGRPFEKAAKLSEIIGPGQVVVAGDGKRAAVSTPGLLTILDAETGRRILVVRPPEGVILSGITPASLSADGKVLAYGGRGRDAKGAVVVWDVEQNVIRQRIDTAQFPPLTPLLSADGKLLATHGPPPPAPRLSSRPAPQAPEPPPPPRDFERTAQVWEVESGKELFRARVTGMGGTAVASAFSRDGSRLAISSGDGPVDVWNVSTGKREQTLLGAKGQGVKVAISPDGKTVASVGPDYRIERWTIDGKPLDITDAPPGLLVAQVTGLAFADNERVIAWNSQAQFAVAWEAPSGRLLSPVLDHQAPILSISFPPGETRDVLTSGVDGRVFRWDYESGQQIEMITLRPARLPGQPLIRPTVYLSNDGKFGTWMRPPAATEVFDIETGSDLFSIPAPSAPASEVIIKMSTDGTKVLTVCRRPDNREVASFVIWDIAERKRFAEFDLALPPGRNPPSLTLSPDDTRMVFLTAARPPAAGRDVLVVTGVDVKAEKKLGEVEDPAATGNMVLVVVDDKTAVLTSSTGRIWKVDYAEGKIGGLIDRLPLIPGEPTAFGPVAFSPDTRFFAVGVSGEEPETYGVRVYEWPSTKLLKTFIGHRGPVSFLRFTADSKFLATGAQDTSVLLWDLGNLAAAK